MCARVPNPFNALVQSLAFLGYIIYQHEIHYKKNGLSLVFLFLFLIALAGQFFTGYKEHNKELSEEGHPEISPVEYVTSGHFIQATFENWESEFLQMALFVLFTVFLYQKGSSESKKIEEEEDVDREPDPHKKDAPWPVRTGGFILALYRNSLSIALVILFILSFVLHLYGSMKDENELLATKGLPPVDMLPHMSSSRFWFESFQNWQSEFLSVFTIVVFSIFFRQKGSSQSKPVDASNSETGE